MNFDVVFLGTGAAVPTELRGTTSQFVSIHGHHYLLDAGEGVQLALRKHRLPFQKIRGIFISHMHGDHVLGLPGLLSTMSLLGRTAPLTVWGPPGLEDWLNQTWRAIVAHFTYDVTVLPWRNEEAMTLCEEERYALTSFPVKHRIEACGIRVEERNLPWSLDGAKVREANLPFDVRKQLRQGMEARWDGATLVPKDWAKPPKDVRSYVFSGDTRPCESLKRHAAGATLLCHDATFMERDSAKAKPTYHSTVLEACRVAHQVEAKRLGLSHISSRYRDPAEVEHEASKSFHSVFVASDGLKVSL